MDRDLILKCSKSIRLEHKLLPEFTNVVAEFCTIKGHSEHTNVIIQLLQHPMIGGEIIHRILEHFEKEFHIVKLEILPDVNTAKQAYGTIQKQLINIY